MTKYRAKLRRARRAVAAQRQLQRLEESRLAALERRAAELEARRAELLDAEVSNEALQVPFLVATVRRLAALEEELRSISARREAQSARLLEQAGGARCWERHADRIAREDRRLGDRELLAEAIERLLARGPASLP